MKAKILSLFIVIFIIPMYAPFAMDTTSQPPEQYLLKEFQLSMTSSSRGVEWTYVVHGSGDVKYKKVNGTHKSYELTDKAVFSLLEKLYELNFFLLEDDTRTTLRPVLFDDGTVRLAEDLLSDVAFTKTCVELPNYNKCVRSISGSSSQLESLHKLLRKLLSE